MCSKSRVRDKRKGIRVSGNTRVGRRIAWVLGLAGMLHGCSGGPVRSISDSVASQSIERGREALAAQDLGEAKAQFARAIRHDGKCAAAHAGLGQVYARRKKWEKASDCFSSAMKLDPRDASYCVGLGNVLLQKAETSMDRAKCLESAIRVFRHAQTIDAGSYPAAMGLASCYRQAGDFDRAIDSLRQAQRVNAAAAEPHTVLAGVYEAQRQPEKAMEEYKTALKLAPEDPVVHNACAALNLQIVESGGPDAAMARQRAAAHYRKSLELDSMQPQIRRALAGLEQFEKDAMWAAGEDSEN